MPWATSAVCIKSHVDLGSEDILSRKMVLKAIMLTKTVMAGSTCSVTTCLTMTVQNSHVS